MGATMKENPGKILSTIVIERVFDLFILAIFLLILLPFAIGMEWIKQLAWVILAAVIIGLGSLFFVTQNINKVSLLLEKISNQLPFFKKYMLPFLSSLLEGFRALQSPSQLIIGFLGIFGSWLVSFIQYTVLLFLLVESPEIWWGAFTNTVLALGVALPSAPAGLGIFESSIVAALNIFKIDQDTALAYALLMHIAQFLVTAGIGFFALLKDGYSLRGLFSNLLNQKQMQLEKDLTEKIMGKRYLITGGAGFIGSNYCHRLLNCGEEVVIYDNLSREGTEKNLAWLYSEFGKRSFQFIQEDIRDQEKITETAKNADVIVHLAGQVAVTTSVQNPRDDFEINAIGTFNVLEAARLSGKQPIVIYASTNKVYGGMDDLIVKENSSQYYYQDFPNGISEERCLDFHSPYGCSKGSGDQYVRDYARIYNIPTIVLRQSCIYGPRQFGIEDQGWVAWFIIASILNKTISIYGDGKQVRDLLFIDDLMDAYDLMIDKVEISKGNVFNIGGGPNNTMSVWSEFGPILVDILKRPIEVQYGNWRPGDQRIYVSDIRKAKTILGWEPKTSVKAGIQKLADWVNKNQNLFQS